MSNSLAPSLIYGAAMVLAACLGLAWSITRYFLDLHQKTTDKVTATIAAKDAEIQQLREENRELRGEVRDLQRERDEWHRSRR